MLELALLVIMIVEDFAPFRQFVAETLSTKPDLCVICEVSDGLEAVRKRR